MKIDIKLSSADKNNFLTCKHVLLIYYLSNIVPPLYNYYRNPLLCRICVSCLPIFHKQHFFLLFLVCLRNSPNNRRDPFQHRIIIVVIVIVVGIDLKISKQKRISREELNQGRSSSVFGTRGGRCAFSTINTVVPDG